jgi:4-carboxymuconolactone decarboxylase
MTSTRETRDTSNDHETAAATGHDTAAAAATRRERFARGMDVIARVNGDIGPAIVDSLADVSPELAHHVVAWAFGEVYARPALPPRDRQLVTLGMLTALGGCEPQLEVHVNTALNVGLTPEQIIEALLQSAVYCGMPRAINATMTARKVFADRGLLPVGAAGGATGD